MAKRKVTHLLALAVLSLLNERPMHPYEASTVMRQRGLDSVIKLTYGSLYSAIEALHREGLVEPVATQRAGRYPERLVYTITAAGQTELTDWLRSLLREPTTEYSPFGAALAFLGNLLPVEVQTLLEEHRGHLQKHLDSIGATLEHGRQLAVDRLFLVEDEYAVALLQARLDFLQQLIQDIADGTLTETRDGMMTWKIYQPEIARQQGIEAIDDE